MSKRFVLIGHPVGHSISPAIHQCAYALLNVEARYDLADCPSEREVAEVVAQIRSGAINGANVTVPWKQAAFDLADHHHQTARDVGVANVLARDAEGRIVAYNTDASALGTELERTAQLAGLKRSELSTALVIGSGGASLAAVVGCRLAGVEEIFVSARRYDPSRARADWPRADVFEALGAKLLAWPGHESTAWNEVLGRCRLLVQATSAGMRGTAGGEELAELIPWAKVSKCAAYDLVYNPPVTPFLRRAEEAGLIAVGGLGMLVEQARDAIEIWLGSAPQADELLAEARKALGS